jgi:lipid II:glycine glycyltransferase (peptidoglycan interpeptide bridge formation enzyme)
MNDFLIREVKIGDKEKFNLSAKHPLQTWQWGEFRENMGVHVLRLGEFDGKKVIRGVQISLHKIPKLNFYVGYIPRCDLLNEKMIRALRDLAKQQNIIFYKLEPNLYEPVTSELKKVNQTRSYLTKQGLIPGKALFTRYSFVLDLAKSEEELLKQMKSKTRYNTRLAEKKGVKIIEDNSDEAFEQYLKLTFEDTTVRQGFYAHSKEYHRKMWETLKPTGMVHLFKATFEGKTLVTWIVFTFNNILYYPYGASASENRKVMASNLMMWEVIKWGKAQGYTHFDMWGSLGPKASRLDSWYGFHRFKEGYGPTLMEFVGTYDLVIDEPKYKIYGIADSLRWKWLKLKKILKI